MSWFNRIFRRRADGQGEDPRPGPTPPERWTVPGVTFDTTGWHLVDADMSRMSWTAPNGRLTLMREEFAAGPPYPTLTDLRNHERDKARGRGEGIVFVDVTTVRSVEVLRAIYKRQDGSGYAYRSVLDVRGRDAQFRIESVMDEGNFTGRREAMVNAMRAQTGDIALGPIQPDGSRALLGHSHDPYDPAFDDTALNAITDDERLDVLMPWHPVSRTRALLDTITGSLRVDPQAFPVRILAMSPRGEELRGPRRQLSYPVLRGLYTAADRFDLAEQALKDELAELGDTPSLRLATCLMQLGTFFHMRDRAGNALPLLSRAEKMFVDLAGHDAPATAMARANHGIALMKIGRRAQALPLLEQAIRVMEKSPPDDSIYILTLAHAAQLLAERGEERTAAEYVSRAQRLMAAQQSS